MKEDNLKQKPFARGERRGLQCRPLLPPPSSSSSSSSSCSFSSCSCCSSSSSLPSSSCLLLLLLLLLLLSLLLFLLWISCLLCPCLHMYYTYLHMHTHKYVCPYMYKSIYFFLFFAVGSIRGPHFTLCWVNKWSTFSFFVFLLFPSLFFFFLQGEYKKTKIENKSLGSISGPHLPPKIRNVDPLLTLLWTTY